MSPVQRFDARSKLGRAAFQMLDLAIKCKPDVRAVVIRVHNAIASNPENKGLRFSLRQDLDFLRKEPRLTSTLIQLWKALPQA